MVHARLCVLTPTPLLQSPGAPDSSRTHRRQLCPVSRPFRDPGPAHCARVSNRIVLACPRVVAIRRLSPRYWRLSMPGIRRTARSCVTRSVCCSVPCAGSLLAERLRSGFPRMARFSALKGRRIPGAPRQTWSRRTGRPSSCSVPGGWRGPTRWRRVGSPPVAFAPIYPLTCRSRWVRPLAHPVYQRSPARPGKSDLDTPGHAEGAGSAPRDDTHGDRPPGVSPITTSVQDAGRTLDDYAVRRNHGSP